MSEKVVVTGASSGIGRQTALAFSAERSELLLVARRLDRLEEVAEQCREMGSPRVLTAALDLSIPGQSERMVREALERLGGLDVLICNAGYGYWGPTWELDPEGMRRMMQVNFHAVYEAMFAALPHWRSSRSGHLVLVSSVIGRKGMPYSAGYSATKFAQAGLGEALWCELGELGVGVSVVCPGYTATEFHAVAAPNHTMNRPVSGQNADVVGRAILRAVRKRRKIVHLTFAGKLLILINRFSDRAAAQVLCFAARLDRKRRKGESESGKRNRDAGEG